MTRPWKKAIAKTLLVVLIASVPVNVLSQKALAETKKAISVSSANTNNNQTGDPTLPPSTPTDNTSDVPSQTNYISVEIQNNAKRLMESKISYKEKHDAIENAIDVFKMDYSVEHIQTLMDLIVYLPVLEDYPDASYVFDKERFSDLTNSYLGYVKNTDEAINALKEHFATISLEQAQKTKSSKNFTIASKAIANLKDGDLKTKLKKDLDALSKIIYGGDTGYIDWNNPGDIKTDPYVPPKEPTIPSNPSYKPPTKPSDNFQTGFNIVRYMNKNNTCYKVTMTKDKTINEVAKGIEKSFCPTIVNETDARHTTTKQVHYNYGGAPISSNSDTSSTNNSSSAINQNDNKEIKNRLTLQYALDKNESQSFYDTDISVSKDGTISYDEAKDILYQIAIKTDGQFVDDQVRSLALIDGSLILLEKGNGRVKVAPFIQLFKPTNVVVQELDTRTGQILLLTDVVETVGLNSITVHDKTVPLSSKPIVSNSQVLFPLSTLVEALNGKITFLDDKVTVSNGKESITYQNGSSTALLNNETVLLKEIPIEKDGKLYVEPTELFKLFHVSMTIDMNKKEVIIK